MVHKSVPDIANVQRKRVSSLDIDDEQIVYYTGLPSSAVFTKLLDILNPVFMAGKSEFCSSLTQEKQILMVLMKRRHAFTHQDLAYHFQVAVAQVSRIFHYWIDLMSRELLCLIHWPDREVICQYLPECFKPAFT